MGQGKSNAARVTMARRRAGSAGGVVGVRVRQQRRLRRLPTPAGPLPPRRRRRHRRRRVGRRCASCTTRSGGREARLAELGAKKVTRPLAEKHPDLRPLVALFSECHELFGDPIYGREAADLAVQTMRRARKTAITLAFDTQSSRADAIPPKIVELVKINACFAVKSWRSNDGFLGDGSFQAGIRATELRMGKDVGTSILTGATAGAVRDRQVVLHRSRRRHRLRRRHRHHRPRHG